MKARQFFQNPYSEEQLKWEDEADVKIYEKIKDFSINQLIIELDEWLNKTVPADETSHIRIITEVLNYRIGSFAFSNFQYFFDVLIEKLEEIEQRMIKLEGHRALYEDHRHKTILGLYTEKAVY